MQALSEQILTSNGAGTHIIHDEEAVGGIGAYSLWTISGGPILILALWGVITGDPMDVTVAELAIQHSQGNSAMCGASASVALDPLATVYYMTGVAATALEKVEPAAAGAPTTLGANLTPIPCALGDIDCVVTIGAQVGDVTWHLVYKELDPLSTVVNAVYA